MNGRQWHGATTLQKKCNNVDDSFLARPAGAIQSVQYGVMGFDKGITIVCNPWPCLERFGLLCIRQYNAVGVLEVIPREACLITFRPPILDLIA